MDAEIEEVTQGTEMPEESAEAWAKAIAKIVKQAEEHYSKMEEMATCESISDAHPC